MNHSNIINLIPGTTYLHRLTGTTKVRLFLVLIVYVMMSFDLPLIAPIFVLALIGLISLRPNWKTLKPIVIIVVLMNLFNLFLFWLADPHYGLPLNGDDTVLFAFNSYLVVTRGTLWYIIVRFIKMITSFLVSMCFIISITPSEIAAGFTSIGLSYKFGSIIEIAFRYIPDISRDYENISVSMQCRGLELDKKKVRPIERMKQIVLILIPLVITSFDRVNDIANAMDLRGFGKYKKRTYYSEHEKIKGENIFVAFYILILALIIIYFVYNIVVTRQTKMWIYW